MTTVRTTLHLSGCSHSWFLTVNQALRNVDTQQQPSDWASSLSLWAHRFQSPSTLTRQQDTVSPHFFLLSGVLKALTLIATTVLTPVSCGSTCPPPQLYLLRMKSQQKQDKDIVRAGSDPADRTKIAHCPSRGQMEPSSSSSLCLFFIFRRCNSDLTLWFSTPWCVPEKNTVCLGQLQSQDIHPRPQAGLKTE